MNKRIRKKIDKLTRHGSNSILARKEKKPATYTTYKKYYKLLFSPKIKGYFYYIWVLNSVKYPYLLPYRFKKKAMLEIARRKTMSQYRPILNPILNTCYGMTTGVVPTDHPLEYQKRIIKELDARCHETVRKYILQNHFPIPPMGLSCCLNLHSLANTALAITAKIEREKRV